MSARPKRNEAQTQTLAWRGHSLSRLSLGTAQLGMEYGIANTSGKPDVEVAAQIVRTALGAGINFFDTARGYGDSEKALGTAINAAGAPQDVHIITKITVEPGASGDLILREIKDSIRALGVDQLFGVLFHNATGVRDHATLVALKSIKTSGLVRHLGVSIYDASDFQFAVDHEALDIIQVPFNLFDRRALTEGWFDSASANDKLVVTRSMFLQGLLLIKPDRLPQHMRFARHALEDLARACEQTHLDTKEACIGFVATHAERAAIVFGAETSAQVQETADLVKGWVGSRKFPSEAFSRLAGAGERELINPSLWPREVRHG